MRSKKAQDMPGAPNMVIYFMIVAFLVPLGAVFLVIATSSYQVKTTSILGGLESDILEFKLLNSPDCFVYRDDISKRVYGHTIDLEKFTDAEAKECKSSYSRLCFRAELKTDKVIKSVQSPNYKNPQEVDVSAWPVRIRRRDDEVPGMMIISTSTRCRT